VTKAEARRHAARAAYQILDNDGDSAWLDPDVNGLSVEDTEALTVAFGELLDELRRRGEKRTRR
jgi:hypothetical protein